MDNGTVYGECRCCLAKGKHRELMTEYYFNGVREVYYDIFGDCYNLFLSKNPKLTSLICDHCISRLRDAFSFRMMVASTERRLLILASNSQNKQKQTPVFVDVPSDNPFGDLEIKAESLATCKYEPEESDDSNDLEYVVADYDVGVYPEDSPTPSPQTSNLVEGEAELLARYPNVKRLPRIGELHSICPTFMAQLNNLNGIPVTSSMLLETEYVKKGGIISEKLAYIHNVTTLLQCSNITPFKSKNRSGYPCFYCKVLFEDFTKLRQHCLEHKSIDIIKSLRQFGPENLLVYADVLDLKCTLCYENVPKLQDLKTHLSKIHNKKFFDDFGDRIIPFKIIGNMYECQICTCLYETFGSLERHMNGHYRNYVCEECGSGFATKCRLKVHVKSMHALGHYPCEICKKTFTTQQRFKNHINSVHKMVKRFKCSKCPERFTEYFKRQKHLVEVHGVEPLRYKCNVCDKSFDRRYTLSRHLKRDHLEERDFECEICGYRSFTKNELKVHMVKHNGERIHNCTVCRKAYARKKTLREHMRIHNNDRRFVCSVCGQAFVQKCSLKGHLKTHHLEFNLQS